MPHTNPQINVHGETTFINGKLLSLESQSEIFKTLIDPLRKTVQQITADRNLQARKLKKLSSGRRIIQEESSKLTANFNAYLQEMREARDLWGSLTDPLYIARAIATWKCDDHHILVMLLMRLRRHPVLVHGLLQNFCTIQSRINSAAKNADIRLRKSGQLTNIELFKTLLESILADHPTRLDQYIKPSQALSESRAIP